MKSWSPRLPRIINQNTADDRSDEPISGMAQIGNRVIAPLRRG
jgi:hypothetical protein